MPASVSSFVSMFVEPIAIVNYMRYLYISNDSWNIYFCEQNIPLALLLSCNFCVRLTLVARLHSAPT